MKPVEIQRLAAQDLFEAIDYYVRNAPQLVGRFQQATDRTMDVIGRSPKAGSLALADTLEIAGLRYRVSKLCPLAVFYQEFDTQVRVLRVLHHGRDIASLIELK